MYLSHNLAGDAYDSSDMAIGSWQSADQSGYGRVFAIVRLFFYRFVVGDGTRFFDHFMCHLPAGCAWQIKRRVHQRYGAGTNADLFGNPADDQFLHLSGTVSGRCIEDDV